MAITANVVAPDQTTLQIANLERLMSGKDLRFCIFRPAGGIGDVLMSFPAIGLLKKKFNAHITYATDYDYLNGALKNICEHNPDIDLVLSHSIFNQFKYDMTVNFYCPCWSHEVPRAQPIHRIDLFARHCGLSIPLSEEDRKIKYNITEEEEEWATNWFKARQLYPERCIMINPYASNSRRSYPASKIRNAIVKLGYLYPAINFLIVQHGSDFDKNTQWDYFKATRLKDFGIVQLAALMNKIPLVVCQDSALLHMAGAINTRTVALFGPTDYRARMYPNMLPVCPAEKLPIWPSWYDQKFAANVFWDLLTEEMLVDVLSTEIKKILAIAPTDSPSNLFKPSNIPYEVL